MIAITSSTSLLWSKNYSNMLRIKSLNLFAYAFGAATLMLVALYTAPLKPLSNFLGAEYTCKISMMPRFKIASRTLGSSCNTFISFSKSDLNDRPGTHTAASCFGKLFEENCVTRSPTTWAICSSAPFHGLFSSFLLPPWLMYLKTKGFVDVAATRFESAKIFRQLFVYA